jgi:hypothetical protein
LAAMHWALLAIFRRVLALHNRLLVMDTSG